jgi:MFS transporter, DHA3 family, macrolide efflux protein
VPQNWKTRFYTIWSGQALSQMGSRVVSFSIIWWLTQETGSATVLATATMMTLLPAVFLGPFSGALVDRWNRRRVMLYSDAAIAVFTAVLAILYFLDAAAPWHIYGIMLIRAIGGTFHGPSMKASTTLMVPNDYLPRVGGMNQTLNGALSIAAPPLGALVIGIMPMHWIMSIDVITAAAAILPLLFIAIPEPVRTAKPERSWAVLHEMMEGLKYVLNSRTLFFIVGSCTLANVFIGPAQSFLPLLITNGFGGGAVELGLATSAAGIGLIVGGLVMTAWGGFKRRLVTSAVGWIGIGIACMAILFIPGGFFLGFVVARFFTGFSTPIGCAPLDAWYQTRVPHDKQGRVFSILGSIDRLTMPFGLAIGAVLSGIVPIRFWWFLLGASHAALGVAWLLMPIVKQADGEADIQSAPAAPIV